MKYRIVLLLSLLIFLQCFKAQVVLKALEAPNLEFMFPKGWRAEIQPIRYLASVYDDNYMPMNTLDLKNQPLKAQLGSQNASATNDPVLDYQGKIGSYIGNLLSNDNQIFDKYIYSVEVNIVKESNVSSLILPEIISVATISNVYIKNANSSQMVYLKSRVGGNDDIVVASSGYYTFYIVAENPIDLIQLDMNRGIGQDGKGILLTTFNIRNEIGSSSQMELRLLPAVPDRYASKRTNSYAGNGTSNYREHEMFYMPIMGPDGKIWLNNNLGAGYSQLFKPYFYPLNQATSKLDHKAYGSLFQWQRKSDGHELVWWVSSQSNPLNRHSEQTSGKSQNWSNAETYKFRVNNNDFYGWNNQNNNGPFNLWLGNNENAICPSGFHVPTKQELDYVVASSGNSITGAQLKLTSAARVVTGHTLLTNNSTMLWSSTTTNSILSEYKLIGSDEIPLDTYTKKHRASAYMIRCIKD